MVMICASEVHGMSWVNDLASVAGIPAGAATLAVAMYAACSAAEKAARPEALKDIGHILKDPSWKDSAQPYAIIQRVFNWTFGERHLSVKCLYRSVISTIIISSGNRGNKGRDDVFIVESGPWTRHHLPSLCWIAATSSGARRRRRG
jgi:hypothetical protein